MIHEIGNFVDTIPPAYHTEGLTPSQGLHILIDLDENGELKKDGYKSFLVKKRNEEIDYNFDFATRLQLAKLVDMNKPIDNKKKIHSAIPFVLIFKNIYTGNSPANKMQTKKEWVVLSVDERFERMVKTHLSNNVKLRIEDYYSFFIKHKDITDNEKTLLYLIKDFSNNKLFDKILSDANIKTTDYDNYINIYFNVPIEYLIKWHDIHIRAKVFNRDDFNTKDNEYGLSNFLNSAPAKKIFVTHRTTDYQVSNRINYKSGIKLALFKNLLMNRKLPSIVPIFIDKEELNGEFVRIFGRDTKQSFREVIRQLFELHKDIISNYYLINWANRGGIVVNDMDYVSSFKYYLNGFIIKNVMGIKNKAGELLRDEVIDNIFHFELSVVQRIFNNALIVKTKKETVLFKYFDDIDSNYTTPANYQNILKYRKNFYDYIYKSNEDALTGKIFYDIIMANVLSDIKQQDDRSFGIKEKLNILFSLNELFDKQNNNFKNIGDKTMASLIPEFQNNLRRLFNETDYHITSDSEFAFAAGQLIYYVLTKSQTSSKTHSLLEPFISKNDPQLFKLAITRGIEQYKHAFNFGSPRFEKLTSEVLGYDCKMNIKELLPVLLAGYFSQSLIYEKSNNQ